MLFVISFKIFYSFKSYGRNGTATAGDGRKAGDVDHSHRFKVAVSSAYNLLKLQDHINHLFISVLAGSALNRRGTNEQVQFV